MNNPADVTVNIEDQRGWLSQHKADTGMSWKDLGALVGINDKTLGLFGTDKYAGNNQGIADAVYRFRQTLTMKAQLAITAPEIPAYFDTTTSGEIMQLFGWAQRGRMTFVAGGPGIGKTKSAEEYRARGSNVWLVTMDPILGKSLNAFCQAVLRAMNLRIASHRADGMSSQIMDRLARSGGLLIIDDAQHCTLDQIEQVRGWYDKTGVGVAFLGNDSVVDRMEGKTRAAQFAQIYSRVGARMVRPTALSGDVEALADAWRVQDEKVVDHLLDIGRRPGGLRSCTFVMELASVLAQAERAELTTKHINAAWTQLSTRAS